MRHLKSCIALLCGTTRLIGSRGYILRILSQWIRFNKREFIWQVWEGGFEKSKNLISDSNEGLLKFDDKFVERIYLLLFDHKKTPQTKDFLNPEVQVNRTE